MIGNPSEQDFKGMVRGNMINNCPVTTKVITKAHAMYGPSLESAREKTVRRMPAPVVVDYVAVPKKIVERNKIVTLAADVYFVDGTASLSTVSRQINFITVKYIAVCAAKNLSKHLEQVIQVYTRAGFNVRTILMDGKFKKACNVLHLVVCNTTVANEHMSEAERSTRTIKEQARGIIGTRGGNSKR
jgi:hypothetical protein